MIDVRESFELLLFVFVPEDEVAIGPCSGEPSIWMEVDRIHSEIPFRIPVAPKAKILFRVVDVGDNTMALLSSSCKASSVGEARDTSYLPLRPDLFERGRIL